MNLREANRGRRNSIFQYIYRGFWVFILIIYLPR